MRKGGTMAAEWDKEIGAMTLFVPDLSAVAAAQPLPEILEEARKGAGQFAIIVGDVDAVCAEIASRGVRPLCPTPGQPGVEHADGDLRRPGRPHLGDRPGTAGRRRLTLLDARDVALAGGPA